jgi:predicted ABC-type ATPase
MPGKSRRLRIMAGPNGSGKSTIVKRIRSTYYCGPYVNADEIQQAFDIKKVLNLNAEYGLEVSGEAFEIYLQHEGASWLAKANQDKTPIHLSFTENNFVVGSDIKIGRYDAAIAADFIRHELLKTEQTFTFETVLSHSSKLGFLQQARQMGYKNYLYFVCTVDPTINIARVAQRVALGGHNVPPDKVTSRYYSSLALLQELIPHTHRTFLFDNSAEDATIELVAEIEDGTKYISDAATLPWWIKEYVIDPLF